jgi:hypothetical protein
MSGRWLCLFCVTKPSHSYMISAKECFTMNAVAEARAPPALTNCDKRDISQTQEEKIRLTS